MKHSLLSGLVCALLLALCGCGGGQKSDNSPKPDSAPAFKGDSSELARTVVVSTLDAPLPQGNNVVWCASFQIAWDKLNKDVVGEDVKLKNAENFAAQLNAGQFPADGLEPESFYAAAGWVKDGIVPKIQKEMQAKFPDVPTPALGYSETVAVAYAFLKAGLKFATPYFENRNPLEFKSSAGAGVKVSSFGIRQEDGDAYSKLREQVDVLMSGENEFALDLDKHSKPYQVIVACVKPKATFKETLAYLDEKLKVKRAGEFEISDVFLIPNINFDIAHRFAELEGGNRPFLNARYTGMHIQTAYQRTQFKLDRSGAEVASEAKLICAAAPQMYIFDKPFLVYLKKRGAEQPFFVLWVDNPELLCKW